MEHLYLSKNKNVIYSIFSIREVNFMLSSHILHTNKIYLSIMKLRIAIKQHNIIHTTLLKAFMEYKH